MIEEGKSPPNGRDLGKRTRVIVGQRVGGEVMGRGNGKSIIAIVMTSRHTNVAFFFLVWNIIFVSVRYSQTHLG